MYTLTITYRDGEKLLFEYETLEEANRNAIEWIYLDNPDIFSIKTDKA